MDRDLPHQQNLANVDLVVLILEGPSNRLADLTPLVTGAEAALKCSMDSQLRRYRELSLHGT
jgi:hypothetical protein